ncbi:unnamed protein product [Brassica oleracea]
MFRAVGSVLKRNKESIYGITRGSTSSSHRAFTSNVTSSTTVNSASSSPLAGNSFNGLRSHLKGQKAPTFRKMMSTLAATSSESKEGLKLLVTGGPQARKLVGTWLFGSAAWVFSMVVLGGVTRLTRSGLSMTDWKFTGEFPPLSDEAWAKEFEKYKQSPEYKRVNKGMNLEDFKFIYWMEYAHLQLSGLFALGAGQGFIGWWMVKSGLEEPPSEYSQPRTALSVVMPEPPAESLAWVRGAAKVKRLALPVSFIVGITAISGAFVAGNDAGRAFNTFPKMGDTWIPDGIFEMKPLIRNFFENTATVQLDHRLLATTTLLAIGTMWWFTRKLDIHPAVKALIGSTVAMTAVQVTLGVSTLLSYVPVSLGSAHQAGALTFLTLMLLLNHTLRRPSPSLLKSLPQVASQISAKLYSPKSFLFFFLIY